MIWVFLVIRELMLSKHMEKSSCFLLVLFIILGNIFAGIIYFFFLRDTVLGIKAIKTK